MEYALYELILTLLIYGFTALRDLTPLAEEHRHQRLTLRPVSEAEKDTRAHGKAEINGENAPPPPLALPTCASALVASSQYPNEI